jgi:hypothetical protein
MKYRIVDAETVPAGQTTASRAAARKREAMTRLITELVPGKAAAVTPEKAETVRGLKSTLTRAGNREGRAVRVWDVDGVVYVSLRGE